MMYIFATAPGKLIRTMFMAIMVGVSFPCNADTQSNTVPLRITELNPETMDLTWASNTNRDYAVDYAANLLNSNWTLLANTVPAGTSNSSTYAVGAAASDPGREAVLLRYRLGEADPQTQDAVNGISGSDLLAGSGLNEFKTNFSGYASSPVLLVNFNTAGADLPTAVSNGNLFTFSLTVGSGVSNLNLTRLEFDAARGGSATPRGYGVMVTTPTTTDEWVQSATDIDTVRPVWSPQSIDLSGMGSLQNLHAGQTVVITIPTYSPNAFQSLEFDNIAVSGIATPLLPGFADADHLFLRVRELSNDPVWIEAAASPGGAPWLLYSTRALAQMPSPVMTGVDNPGSYGGDPSVQTNATGFFYPQKIGDRWWLIDPQGYRFLHKGVAAIEPVNSTGGDAALQSKFGNTTNWASATTALLQQYGFNGAGSWSDTDHLKDVPNPLVYTVKARFLAAYTQVHGTTGYPRVFDPGFETFCDSHAAEFSGMENDPYLLGYYTDNELNFPTSLLTDWLNAPGAGSSYDEAWRWLRERYGMGAVIGDVTLQDQYDFLGHVWGQYSRLVNEAIRSVDTNHLVLGSRLYGSDKSRPEIFAAIGPYLDVVSVNYYGKWTPEIEQMRMWESESGRPVMISEFYVKGEDSGMPNTTGAGWVVRNQNDRGLFYQNFVLDLLESEVCVGWHWFKYADNDPDDPDADPSNLDSNKGVVSNRYDPYTDLLEAARCINERIYRLTDYFDGKL